MNILAINNFRDNSYNNSKKIISQSSQPIRPQPKDTISFSGKLPSKSAVKATLGGAAAGLIAGYWITCGAALKTAIPIVLEKASAQQFERDTVEAVAFDNQDDRDKIIDTALEQIEKKPESPYTRDCLDIVEKYDVANDEQQAAINLAIEDKIDSEKLDEKSSQYFEDYLNSQKKSSEKE